MDMKEQRNPGLARPDTRAARLSVIEQMLASQIVTSQSQLSDLLNAQGIEVTQATLSRDLDELNASKTRLTDGTVAYTVAEHPLDATPIAVQTRVDMQVAHAISGLVTSVAAAQNLVVVHTPSGAAQYVASVIDKQPLHGVLGTIAGDDTVLMVCGDEDLARDRAGWLLTTVSKRTADEPAADESATDRSDSNR